MQNLVTNEIMRYYECILFIIFIKFYNTHLINEFIEFMNTFIERTNFFIDLIKYYINLRYIQVQHLNEQ